MMGPVRLDRSLAPNPFALYALYGTVLGAFTLSSRYYYITILAHDSS